MLAGLAAVALLAGCSSGTSPTASSTDSATDTAQSKEPVALTVLAAASLTDVLPPLAEEYAKEHPEVSITFSFGSSAGLAQQVVSGAPADVLITASAATMAPVTAAKLNAGEPVGIARNTLQIVVPAGNPGKITGLADFAKPELKIALCAETVPCGTAADQSLAKANVTPSVDTREQDVRAVLTKVELGEVDAGIVYRTDVTAAGDKVAGVDIPADLNVTVDNQAVALTSANTEAAQGFVTFLTSNPAQESLTAAGFERP